MEDLQLKKKKKKFFIINPININTIYTVVELRVSKYIIK